jgi:hypothetical protein
VCVIISIKNLTAFLLVEPRQVVVYIKNNYTYKEKTMYLKEAIHKQALKERIGDAVLGGLGSGVLGATVPFGRIPTIIGTASGLTEENAKKELKDRGSIVKSIIPGVGPYRQALIARAVADESGKRGRQQLKHEIFGGATGTLTSMLAGAGIGAGAGALTEGTDDAALMGALIGGTTGALLPHLSAATLALMKNTRTKKEQSEHEKKNLALNYIPGVATYNQLKRLGSGYDRYFEGKEKINKNAGDQSMGYLTEAITGQTSEPRKQAVRNLLSKQALEGPVGSMAEKLKNLDRKDVGPAAAGGGIESYDKKKEKKGKMKKRTKPMRKSLKQLKKQYKRTPYNPITKEAAGAMANVKSQALAGGLLGSAAGAGYQALENVATGNKHKLRDYIRSTLIGGGIGAAGGAAVGAARGSDRLDSIQDADAEFDRDMRDTQDSIRDVLDDVRDSRLDELEGVIPKESMDGGDASTPGFGASLGAQLRNKMKGAQEQKDKLYDKTVDYVLNPFMARKPKNVYSKNVDKLKGEAAGAAKDIGKARINQATTAAKTAPYKAGQAAGAVKKNVQQAAKEAQGYYQNIKDKAGNVKKKFMTGFNKESSDRKAAVRDYITKLADDGKCSEREGHYCSDCGKYGESMTCPCGSSCACGMSKEAGDYSCPGCGKACPDCGSMKKEASDPKEAVRALLKKEAYGPFGVGKTEAKKQYNQPAPWSADDTNRAEARYKAGYRGRVGSSSYRKGLQAYMKKIQQMRANQFKAQKASGASPDGSDGVDDIADNLKKNRSTLQKAM